MGGWVPELGWEGTRWIGRSGCLRGRKETACGLLGGWLSCVCVYRKMERNEAVRMSYCELGVGRWVGRGERGGWNEVL